MQRNYKLIVSIIALAVVSLGAFAQEVVKYKDVILDGKPAKLNVVTGEITLVKPEIKTKVNTSDISEESTDESDFHIVKENETLLDISKKYKLTLTELKQANNLETTLIDKGQRLRVKNLGKLNVLLDKPSIDSDNITSNFHVVKKGETLYSLSKRYNLTVTELKNKNGLNTNLIKVGQKLRVKDFGLNNEIDNISVWTVKKGDTLFSIAKRSGVTIDAIKQLNGLSSNTIMIGQILQLK